MVILGYVIVVIFWIYYFSEVLNYFFTQKPQRLLKVSMFLVPFYSVSLSFIVQISFYKVFIIPFLLIWFFTYGKFKKSLVVLALYTICITAISLIYVTNEHLFDFAVSHGRGYFQARIYWLVQFIFNILALSSIFVMIKIGLSKNDSINAIKAYIYGCVVIVLIGFVQQFFYYSGIEWFEFWFLTDPLGREVTARGLDQMSLQGMGESRHIYRMSSLAGEPRHFAAFIVVGLMSTLFLKHRVGLKNANSIFIFLMIGLLMSLSTSGMLSFVVGFSFYTLITSISRKRGSVFLITFAVVGMLFLLLPNVMDQIFWKATSIDMMKYAAPKDAFALNAITNDLFHFMFGYGPGLADIQASEFWFHQTTPFKVHDRSGGNGLQSLILPTSFIMQIILSYGVTGFLIISYVIFDYIHIVKSKALNIMTLSFLSLLIFGSTLIGPVAIVMISLFMVIEHKQEKVRGVTLS